MNSQRSTTKPDPGRSAVVALGSNMAFEGRSPAQLVCAAAERLSQLSETQVQLSTLHRTTPQGLDAGAADFCNAVAILQPAPGLCASDLLAALLSVEGEFGRQRLEPEAGASYASRTLDLDLIYCRGERVDSDFLQLPHPRAAERLFVLAPLAEVWPDLCLDANAEPVSLILKRLARE